MDQDNKKNVYTYDPEQIHKEAAPKKGGWKKGLLICVLIICIFVVAGIGFDLLDFSVNIFSGGNSDSSQYEYSDSYIGVLPIHGTIGESGGEYDHTWLLERIEQMAEDDENKGLMLSIDTPGGAVYETDELYFAVKEYQKTGKPVYSYMESMAASGGYYISAPCDKIYANRNCWTGSIGVTIGTLYDVSGFLEKAGIKTVTITSGANKAMGSSVDPLTSEQKEIFQSLVDEAYEQFVGIVAEGRNMDIKAVKKLADGRIYTAAQAEKAGLIDGIASQEDALKMMMQDCKLQDCETEYIEYDPPVSWRSVLDFVTELKNGKVSGEYEQLMKILDENNKFAITYMAQIER